MFCKAELAKVYLQIPIEAETHQLLKINIHHGPYQYTRLSLDVKTAPGIFHQGMDAMTRKVQPYTLMPSLLSAPHKKNSTARNYLWTLKNMASDFVRENAFNAV